MDISHVFFLHRIFGYIDCFRQSFGLEMSKINTK